MTFIIIFHKVNSADYQGVLQYANKTSKSWKGVNWTPPFFGCDLYHPYYQGNDYFMLGINFGENDRKTGAWCDTKGYNKHFYICEGL